MATAQMALATKRGKQTSILIRGLNPGLKERLRVRAAQHGRSMEAEARQILEEIVMGSGAEGRELPLADRIHARFAGLGGFELKLPGRGPERALPRFDEN